MSTNIGHGNGSSKASRFPPTNSIWFFFSTLCIICMLTCRHLISMLHTMLPLLIEDVEENNHPQSQRPLPSSSEHKGQQQRQEQCGIWMAPSSLRPYPGYGIYTTRDIEKGDSILGAPDAVSIPLHDMRRKNEQLPLYRERRRLWNNVFSNYVWAHGMPDHSRYDHPPDTVDFQPGFGSLPNHHCLLQSLGQAPSEVAPYNDGLLASDSNNTRTSPGLGAFSYHVGRDFYAKRDLKAGEEIFLNYGYCNRESPVENNREVEDIEWYEKLIYPDDVKEATRLLLQYRPFGLKPWPMENTTSALLEHITEESSSQYSDPQKVLFILSQAVSSKVRQSLYEIVGEVHLQSKKSLRKMMGRHASKKDSYETLARKRLWFELAKLSLNNKTPEWIRENGLCLENLLPKKSTIPHAGFGGFAQYGINKGEIIVPAPVLHVVNKEVLDPFGGSIPGYEDDSLKDYLSSFKSGTSLLVNYCFGHPKSSMLMCPMTSAMLVNHCSNRSQKCGPDGPNAEVRWSSGWDTASHEWRNKSLHEIDQHFGRVLSLEIVALRDIAQGEEVFIDYGIDWEDAWDEHVRSWRPPDKIPNFVTASEANERYGPVLDELISNDLRKTVNHPYLFTGCQYNALPDVENAGNYTEKWKNKWKELSDSEILETFSTDGSEFLYEDAENYVGHDEFSHWPCSILYAEEEQGRYTVRIHMSPLKDVEPEDTPWHKNEVPRILTNYSQESIHYFVKPSATDQSLPNAFRHSIGFPDNLFPKRWKDESAKL